MHRIYLIACYDSENGIITSKITFWNINTDANFPQTNNLKNSSTVTGNTYDEGSPFHVLTWTQEFTDYFCINKKSDS